MKTEKYGRSKRKDLEEMLVSHSSRKLFLQERKFKIMVKNLKSDQSYNPNFTIFYCVTLDR